jgi:hypothetical protein
LFFEALEQRTLLAGDVTAFVVDGDLVIRGSNDDNQIEISAIGNGIDITPTGVKITPLEDTTINGAAETVVLSGITDDWRINLRHGNNKLVTPTPRPPPPPRLYITHVYPPQRDWYPAIAPILTVPDDLIVNTGHGNDEIDVKKLVVHGDARVSLRDGSNQVFLGTETSRIAIYGDLRIKTGAGSDFIRLGAGSAQNLNIKTGDGNDVVTVGGQLSALLRRTPLPHTPVPPIHFQQVSTASTADSDLASSPKLPFLSPTTFRANRIAKIETGAGHDTVNVTLSAQKLGVHLRAGDDALFVQTLRARSLWVRGDTGDDVINLENLSISRRARVITDAGNDDVTVANDATVDRAFFDLGSHDDKLAILDGFSTSEFVGALGDGEDEFTVDLGCQSLRHDIPTGLILRLYPDAQIVGSVDAGAGTDIFSHDESTAELEFFNFESEVVLPDSCPPLTVPPE